MKPDQAIATAADYADAMLIARRAKNVLVLLLLLIILAQLSLFFVARFTDVLGPMMATTEPTTLPSSLNSADFMNFLANGSMFLGLTLTIVLGFVLLLIVNIMLVGRLIGVAMVTGAYIWSLILLVLLFPWQSFLNNVGLTLERAQWKIPGILYTWSELSVNAKFSNDDFAHAFLHWTRFAGMPIIAIIILLAIQVRSNRGMRAALGEEVEVHVELKP